MPYTFRVIVAVLAALAAATGEGDGTCEAGEECPSDFDSLLQMGLMVHPSNQSLQNTHNASLQPAAVSAAASKAVPKPLIPASVSSGARGAGATLEMHNSNASELLASANAWATVAANASATTASLVPPVDRSVLGYYRQVLHNEQDLQYSGTVKLGGQSLKAVLDTGSFELLVFSSGCFTCGLAAGYDFMASPTYKSGFLMTTQNFGSGTCHSVDGTDTLQVGNASVINQDFWEVLRAEMPVLKTANFQAILGLSPPGEPQLQAEMLLGGSERDQTIADIILQKSDSVLMNLNVRYFSACLELAKGAPGYIVWNDRAPKEQPVPFTELVVTDDIHWYTRMSSVRLTPRSGKSTMHVGCENGCQVLFDTGTSLIAVPSATFQLVLKELNNLNQDCTNLEQMPDLVFELGNHTHTLPATTYIGSIEGYIPDGVKDFFRAPHPTAIGCRLLLMEAPPGEDLWILGMPFFRYYYTLFDLGEHPYKMDGRRIWTAPAGKGCQLTDGARHEDGLEFSWEPWRVNATMIRPPRKRRFHGARGNMAVFADSDAERAGPPLTNEDYSMDHNPSHRRASTLNYQG